MAMSVLIVDDSRLARMMVGGLISERWPDCTVVESENAEQALASARTTVPDHIILDHNMPGEVGLDVVERLRDAAPQASITLVTANIQSSIRARAQALGCHFVAKPVTAEKIDRLLSDIGAQA